MATSVRNKNEIFWNTSEGFIHLPEVVQVYRKNIIERLLIQEKGLRNKDRESLSLYVRNHIRELYKAAGKEPIEMKLRKDMSQIGALGSMMSAKTFTVMVAFVARSYALPAVVCYKNGAEKAEVANLKREGKDDIRQAREDLGVLHGTGNT
ncbi:unnamed protein product [Nippostrongylus brasiliensis]|uniref:Uncharacterized protein n=1 Tax=Nippostrongylus brasiliensis TaxID=27835 RepID=A0A0N4XDY5_NIPBR|nr:unnamed protein product [Nippostrongylus brasiliensis]